MPVANVCARESVAHKAAGAAVVSLADDDEHPGAQTAIAASAPNAKDTGRRNAKRIESMMNLSPLRATFCSRTYGEITFEPSRGIQLVSGRETTPRRNERKTMKPCYFLPFSPLALVAAVAAFEACSSSSSNGGAPATTDQDADTSSDTGSGPSGPVQCGPPPYITLGLVIQAASTTKNPPRVGGATLTSPLCPDASFTSDDDGGIIGLVTKDVPFYGRFNAPGYAPTLSPQEQFTVDTPGLAIALPPSLLTIIVPNYDTTKPLIFIDVRLDTGTTHPDGGPNCNDVSGVSFSVDGHPEAQITYYSADAVPQPVSGAMATSGGAASITGIDVASSPVTITGTKPGCTVAFSGGAVAAAATGKIPLEDAYVSIAAAYLRN